MEPLRDLNIYNIHLLVGLFGNPNRVEYLPNVERGVDTSGILVLDYCNFKAAAIGAKDCSAEIRSTIQGDKGAITIFGVTNTLPEIGYTATLGQYYGQADEYFYSSHRDTYYYNPAYIYEVVDFSEIGKPLEDFNNLAWFPIDEAIAKLKRGSHKWGIEQWKESNTLIAKS